MEIIMETDVIVGKEYDGTNWKLTIHGRKVGPYIDDKDMRVVLSWFHSGGLQGIIDAFEAILDKAFIEQEQKMALVFILGTIISIDVLIWAGKIDGSVYTSGLNAAGLALAAYLGVNAAGAAINKFGKK
jgi:hypothetical protein